MSQIKTNYLTSPIGKVLFFKSLPSFLALFASITYNLVDTFFVAKLGTDELAAMGFSFPLVMIILNLMVGLATGLSSVASQAFGKGQFDEAKKSAEKAIQLTLVFSFVIFLLGFFTLEPLFSFMGASKNLIPHIKHYMLIWYAGSFFMNFTFVGGSFLRAKGDVFYPSFVLILGAVLNAILDPILIFGFGPIPAMGLQGAAITTVIGNFIAALLLFSRMKKRDGVSLTKAFTSFDFKLLKKISFVAVPTALTNSFTPLSSAFTNWLLISYGSAAVAANSIATRVETLPFVAIFALGSILSPFIGQNWGAQNRERIQKAIKKSFFFSYFLGALCAFLFIYKRSSISSFFDSSEQVVTITSSYFLMVPITYGILGTVFLCNNSMNAIGKPIFVNLISASRLLIIYPPLAYVLKVFFGVEGIFFSRVIANLLVGIFANLLIYKTFFKQQGSEAFSEEKN